MRAGFSQIFTLGVFFTAFVLYFKDTANREGLLCEKSSLTAYSDLLARKRVSPDYAVVHQPCDPWILSQKLLRRVSIFPSENKIGVLQDVLDLVFAILLTWRSTSKSILLGRRGWISKGFPVLEGSQDAQFVSRHPC